MDKATAFLTTEAVDASVRSVVLQGTTLDQFRYVVEILTAAATRDAFVEDGGWVQHVEYRYVHNNALACSRTTYLPSECTTVIATESEDIQTESLGDAYGVCLQAISTKRVAVERPPSYVVSADLQSVTIRLARLFVVQRGNLEIDCELTWRGDTYEAVEYKSQSATPVCHLALRAGRRGGDAGADHTGVIENTLRTFFQADTPPCPADTCRA